MNPISTFQNKVWDYYRAQGRDLPWRRPEANGIFDPYKILVSELMLQQTQVSRVIPKYHEFLKQFPDIHSLAASPLREVLKVWSGLGYNRRAKYLHEAARTLSSSLHAQFAQGRTLSIAQGPTLCKWRVEELVACKGIGRNTAAAVAVYAYNEPLVFIETNIRTVFIHHFFKDQADVSDAELMPFIEGTLPKDNPREWYWALMDYGSYLKKEIGNISRRSKHYVRQSPLEGSRRQIRGKVLRLLVREPQTYAVLEKSIPDIRLKEVLEMLASEGLIHTKNDVFYL